MGILEILQASAGERVAVATASKRVERVKWLLDLAVGLLLKLVLAGTYRSQCNVLLLSIIQRLQELRYYLRRHIAKCRDVHRRRRQHLSGESGVVLDRMLARARSKYNQNTHSLVRFSRLSY
jgi:hypothetical protein